MTSSYQNLIKAHLPLNRGPWETREPFLFCVHHHDEYPRGDQRMAPVGGTAGRHIGSDFSNRDGWSMYHGDVVPGFPQHPHRGFETISIVRRGLIDHSDSLGATARIGAGDVQWMTAGAGIVHAEMFPLVNEETENHTDFFQIWINLPAKRKMTPPAFKMFWGEEVPEVKKRDASGRESTIRVVAGSFEGKVAPPPPEASWAADPKSEVAIWLIDLEAEAEVTLPSAPDGVDRVIYHVDGGEVVIGKERLSPSHGAHMVSGLAHPIKSSATPTSLLMLQARPIGEPVAQHGPFVMNTTDELRRAFYDYRRTQFGGWPWKRSDPVHDRKLGRFARYADGREDRPPIHPPAQAQTERPQPQRKSAQIGK